MKKAFVKLFSFEVSFSPLESRIVLIGGVMDGVLADHHRHAVGEVGLLKRLSG